MKRIIFSFTIVAFLMTGCYKDDINDLKGKYNSLQTELEKQAQNYQTILNALQNQLTVTGVENTSSGYKIVFSDGKTIDLTQGHTPVFTVGDNGNWHVDGVDTKVKAEGSTPEIVDGYWYIDGENTEVKADGAATSIIGIVIQDGDMTFTFGNGETITVPMSQTSVVFSVASLGLQVIKFGGTREFAVMQSGVQNLSISKPDGWRVSLNDNKLSVTAPDIANSFAEQTGIVSVVAVGERSTVIANVQVTARDFSHLIDFEDYPRILDYLTGPTSYGENLYTSFGAGQYVGYDDAGSGLIMMVNESIWTGEIDFFGGGIAISQWNNMVDDSYINQCSVYYSDDETGHGGYNGSETFAVGFGFNDLMMGDTRSVISFDDGATECTFDHFWVTNSSYAALSMLNGDMASKKLSYADADWFKVVITAYDKTDSPTGTAVEFYLADFRTATSPGIITEWTMVDLTPLGNNVHTVKFDLQSSDTGMYGMNTPAYFCFDNLAIKK